MVNSIHSDHNTPSIKPIKDKREEMQDLIKQEQESFSKLIEEKAQNNAVEKQEKQEKQTSISNQQSKTTSEVQAQSTQANKTLGDVKKLADEKGLDAQNLSLQKEKNTLENKESIGTQNLLAQKTKENISTQAISEPLAQALKVISSQDTKNRKAQKINKIQYKHDGKAGKVALIQRGKNLPKEIVEAKLRNEKREAAYNKAFQHFGVKGSANANELMQEALSLNDGVKKKSLEKEMPS